MADNKEKDIKSSSGSVFNSSDFKNVAVKKEDGVKPESTNQPAPNTPPVQPKNTIIQDKNETFFEKFEKSKRDFAKEKRKEKNLAKKSISTKNKLLGFENRLRDDGFFKKFWIVMISVTAVLLIYACIVIGFLGPYFSSVADTSKWVPAVNIYGGLTKTSIIFSGIAICLIPIPYIFLLALWFVGVNNVHRSKPFIVSNLVILSISAVLLILVIPLSSIVFNQVIGYSPLQ
ncbi:MAG: hypothetical protein K2J69_01915, partial [Malacoplasma sp.]|nr:hypothetical protein [Malacoplasma sp.]MDE5952608.1 hypothetical protein [Malacoplasma sp.]MDE6646045.1 hypothetical protein [Malacoplasma sp.]MDE6893789.1 hypothetical protein [Malacoplasma sp.]MDE7075058.1 hypothetical protein [Malacoplasma sp.]